MEGKCALDAEDVTITLFNFNELDPKTNGVQRGYRLAQTIQARPGEGGGAAQEREQRAEQWRRQGKNWARLAGY